MEEKILAGLADLLDLPPEQAPAAVLTKLADQLGCNVAADGTLTVRNEPEAANQLDDDAHEQVPTYLERTSAHTIRHRFRRNACSIAVSRSSLPDSTSRVLAQKNARRRRVADAAVPASADGTLEQGSSDRDEGDIDAGDEIADDESDEWPELAEGTSANAQPAINGGSEEGDEDVEFDAEIVEDLRRGIEVMAAVAQTTIKQHAGLAAC